jgi:two-component system NtrC family sensor kinase
METLTAVPGTKPDAKPRIAWHQSLKTRAIVAVILIAAWMAGGIIYVIRSEARPHIESQAFALMEQTGNTVVTGLNARLDEIEALTRSLAAAARILPTEETVVMNSFPALVDYGGDQGVAGGGFWPEPRRFDPERDRRSFFWGRGTEGALEYFDGYNQPGPGYHNEEWYVPARYTSGNECYWSQSYTDPYSLQPMVTCTVAIREGEAFNGNVTVDLRLEGLAAFTQEWGKRTGGYIFLVDRYNRFITFPQADLVKRVNVAEDGTRTEEFILAADLTEKAPEFAGTAALLDDMNKEILKLASGANQAVIAESIDEGSYQIDKPQSELTAAVLADPFKDKFSQSTSVLYRTAEVPSDPVLKKPSTVFLFHIPGPYWKLGIVRPTAETVALADTITTNLVLYLLATVLVVILIGYLLFDRFLLVPITRAAKAVQQMGQMIGERRHHELDSARIDYGARNEIGTLCSNINALAHEVVDSEGKLAEANASLEIRVQERTEELRTAMDQLKSSQTRLIQSEKMATLGQMVAGIAHEINTPLGYVKNNIMTTGELLKPYFELGDRVAALDVNQPASADVVELADFARTIKEEKVAEDIRQLTEDGLFGVEQIAELVVNLRNFSRLDEARLKQVDIHECIETALSIARHQIKDKLEVVKDYGPDVPRLTCSPSQINQVFINLLTNAAQAMDQKGKLLIRTRFNNGFVHVAVQDNGKGMPKNVMDRIFEPFFTTKGAGHGTGLGLAITHQIIEQHSGRINVASEPGKGTRFIISLPAADQAAAA